MIHCLGWGRPGRDHSSTGFPLEFRTNHLEGFAVITGRGNSEVALSKNDVCITSDVPMFATSKCKIIYVGKVNTRSERETEMTDVRW